MFLRSLISPSRVWGLAYSVLFVLGGIIGTTAMTQTAQAQGVCGATLGPLGATCSGGAGSVSIVINQEGLPAINRSSSGAVEIDCCEESGISGTASCGCELISVAPFDLFPIGYICLAPGSDLCDFGEVDCDGGHALDIEVQSDHSVGTCTTNSECEGTCDSFCAGLAGNSRRAASSCEGRCSQGTCSGAATACTEDYDCPATETCDTIACSNDGDCLPSSGSCSGRAFCGGTGASCDSDADCAATVTCDGPSHPATCNCTCGEIGTGPPSPAGALSCNLSAEISVEAAAPCGDGDVTIAVGDQCIPLTTELATVTMSDVNNSTGSLGPFTTLGAPADCDDMAVGTLTGLSLGGVSAFFDSSLGDLAVQTTFTCD